MGEKPKENLPGPAKVLTSEQTSELLGEHILVTLFEREAEKVTKEFPDVDKKSFIMGLTAGARISSEHELMMLYPESPAAKKIMQRELKALHKDMFSGKPIAEDELRKRLKGIIAPKEVCAEGDQPIGGKTDPLIQLYSPVQWHGSAAIVVNEAGKKLLMELLESQGEVSIGEAFVSDGEGFTLGVIRVSDEKCHEKEGIEYTLPYTDPMCHGYDMDKIDPRGVVDEKEALDKAEFEQERDMSGA